MGADAAQPAGGRFRSVLRDRAGARAGGFAQARAAQGGLPEYLCLIFTTRRAGSVSDRRIDFFAPVADAPGSPSFLRQHQFRFVTPILRASLTASRIRLKGSARSRLASRRSSSERTAG